MKNSKSNVMNGKSSKFFSVKWLLYGSGGRLSFVLLSGEKCDCDELGEDGDEDDIVYVKKR